MKHFILLASVLLLSLSMNAQRGGGGGFGGFGGGGFGGFGGFGGGGFGMQQSQSRISQTRTENFQQEAKTLIKKFMCFTLPQTSFRELALLASRNGTSLPEKCRFSSREVPVL